MTQRIQVKVAGKSLLTLNQNDFVAAGGEASIYRKGDTVYKIYNSSKTGLNAMEQKVKLLSSIKHRGIIAPVDSLYDKQNNVVGFTMPYVAGEVMVRYFNNEFRKRINYGLKETIKSAYEMREIVAVAHAGNAIIVDGNEMNYIISPKEEVCIIDVDSWQIGQFQATAIMASIRDYHTQGFNELTDWFSWGIVSFQLFVGIHPYRGRHPRYKPGDFVERMKDGVSVFNKDVFLPSIVRDLKDVPAGLLEWYEATFEKGERTLPPSTFEKQDTKKIIQKTVYKLQPSTGVLRLLRQRVFESPVIHAFPNGTIITQQRIHTKTSRLGVELYRLLGALWNSHKDFHCVSTDHGVLVARSGLTSDVLWLIDGDDVKEIKTGELLFPKTWMSGSNRLFGLTDDGFTEIKVGVANNQPYAYLGNTWNVGPNSTFVGQGAAVYNALGTPFVVLPYEKNGCLIEKQSDLKDGKLIAVKAIDKFVTCLVKDNKGQNFKLELYYQQPSTPKVWVGPTDETGLNFAVNHRGIVATIVDDGELVLFSPDGGQSKRISDSHIKASMVLCPVHDNIGFIKDNELWSISTT